MVAFIHIILRFSSSEIQTLISFFLTHRTPTHPGEILPNSCPSLGGTADLSSPVEWAPLLGSGRRGENEEERKLHSILRPTQSIPLLPSNSRHCRNQTSVMQFFTPVAPPIGRDITLKNTKFLFYRPRCDANYGLKYQLSLCSSIASQWRHLLADISTTKIIDIPDFRPNCGAIY